MGNLLFSPDGRINSSDFMRAGFILILIGAAFSMTPFLGSGIASIAQLLSLLIMYPWVVVWVKRLHNGGKSGWAVLLYILIYLIFTMIAVGVVLSMVGDGEFFDVMSEQMSGDITQAEATQRMEIIGKTMALPMTVATLIASLLTLFLGDKMIPNDPEENQYGPGEFGSTFD